MSEFTESEIRSKERRLQEIGKKVTACMEKERSIRAELDRRRNELASNRSFIGIDQIQRNIADHERKLTEALRERERCERERERLSRELERLQQNLKWEDSLHREEKKRKQAQEKTKREFSHIAAFSAGAVAGIMSQKGHSSSQESGKQKRKPLRIWGKVFLFLIIAGAILNVVSPKSTESTKQTEEGIPVVTAETAPLQDEMAQWIGFSAGEIYDQYGETNLTSYMNGGSYFYYEDQTVCPYEFFYEDSGDEITRENLIYGIGTGVEGTPVIGDMQIGDPLQQVEEMIGTSLSPEIMEGSDFYPYLGIEIQIDGIQYWLYFGPESKNLVYVQAIKKLVKHQ